MANEMEIIAAANKQQQHTSIFAKKIEKLWHNQLKDTAVKFIIQRN